MNAKKFRYGDIVKTSYGMEYSVLIELDDQVYVIEDVCCFLNNDLALVKSVRLSKDNII